MNEPDDALDAGMANYPNQERLDAWVKLFEKELKSGLGEQKVKQAPKKAKLLFLDKGDNLTAGYTIQAACCRGFTV